jgi:death-on-curing protein
VTVYLSIAQILDLQAALMKDTGGLSGLRDRGGLESACARPAMTFAGDDLYPDLAAKAAALMHSLVLNHPFVDGNKRIGVHAAELFILLNGRTLDGDDDELEGLTLDVAAGNVSHEALAIWIRQRLGGTDG